MLRSHSRTRMKSMLLCLDLIGCKYKISNIQDAMGCAQLIRVEDPVNQTPKSLSLYREGLSDYSVIFSYLDTAVATVCA